MLKSQNYREEWWSLLPCPAHSEAALKPSSTTDNSEDVQKARLCLQMIRRLTEGPLPDAIRLMGITETESNTFKLITQLFSYSIVMKLKCTRGGGGGGGGGVGYQVSETSRRLSVVLDIFH